MTVARMHVAALAAIVLAMPGVASALPLRVIVPSVGPEEQVVVGVYNDPAAWRGGGAPLRVAVAPVREGVADITFNVPAGRYAVVAFRDSNRDGKLATLPFGWPMEKVGYSGGARPMFGRPSWDDTEFGVSDDGRMTVYVRPK